MGKKEKKKKSEKNIDKLMSTNICELIYFSFYYYISRHLCRRGYINILRF